MRQVPLGRTGLTVSEVAFGGIPIQRLTEQEAVTVVTRCMDLGITFLDTAHGYGTSEERIGKAIAGRRDGLVLGTKSPARQAEPFREQMELSFRRLGVEYIDIFQFHNIATQEALDQVLAPGGSFVAKVFQGGTEHQLLHMLKQNFATTLHAKPKASRSDSAETYLVARGFKSKPPAAAGDADDN